MKWAMFDNYQNIYGIGDTVDDATQDARQFADSVESLTALEITDEMAAWVVEHGGAARHVRAYLEMTSNGTVSTNDRGCGCGQGVCMGECGCEKNQGELTGE